MDNYRVHHPNWDKLSDQRVNELFDLPLTYSPHPILPYLSKAGAATLEIMEDRGNSTIYRIRETGYVYKVSETVQVFNSYPEYCLEEPTDRAKRIYSHKEPVFTVRGENGQEIIERLKKPPFRAKVNGLEITDIEWIEGEPDQAKTISTLKKAKAFLQSWRRYLNF